MYWNRSPASDAVHHGGEAAVLVAQLDGVLTAVGDLHERMGNVRALDGLEVVGDTVPEGEPVTLLRAQQGVAVDRIPGRVSDAERVVRALAPVGEAHLDADGAALRLLVDRDRRGDGARPARAALRSGSRLSYWRSKTIGIGPGSSKSTALVRSRPVITSTGWPVKVQMSQLKNLPGLSRLNSLSENHLVRDALGDRGHPVHRVRSADDHGLAQGHGHERRGREVHREVARGDHRGPCAPPRSRRS